MPLKPRVSAIYIMILRIKRILFNRILHKVRLEFQRIKNVASQLLLKKELIVVRITLIIVPHIVTDSCCIQLILVLHESHLIFEQKEYLYVGEFHVV